MCTVRRFFQVNGCVPGWPSGDWGWGFIMKWKKVCYWQRRRRWRGEYNHSSWRWGRGRRAVSFMVSCFLLVVAELWNIQRSNIQSGECGRVDRQVREPWEIQVDGSTGLRGFMDVNLRILQTDAGSEEAGEWSPTAEHQQRKGTFCRRERAKLNVRTWGVLPCQICKNFCLYPANVEKTQSCNCGISIK